MTFTGSPWSLIISKIFHKLTYKCCLNRLIFLLQRYNGGEEDVPYIRLGRAGGFNLEIREYDQAYTLQMSACCKILWISAEVFKSDRSFNELALNKFWTLLTVDERALQDSPSITRD